MKHLVDQIIDADWRTIGLNEAWTPSMIEKIKKVAINDAEIHNLMKELENI